MSSYLSGKGSTRITPQSEPIPGSSQVENSAGGFTWTVDPFERLRRFLILGSEGGSYYANARNLTLDNISCVRECYALNPTQTLFTINAVSAAGRAPKNDPAIYALAMGLCHPDVAVRKLAVAHVNPVCRTGTHIFMLAEFIELLGGWGRLKRRAVGEWYEQKDTDRLAYQLVKYRQRGGWTHRDLLRLSHPQAADDGHKILYEWATHGPSRELMNTLSHGWALPRMIEGFEKVQAARTPKLVADLVTEFNLPREAIPTEYLDEVVVWEALLHNKGEIGMPMTALIRNLGNMTRLGVLEPMSQLTRDVCKRIVNEEHLTRSRVHPINILVAMKTYSSGHGLRGKHTWSPLPLVVDALDAAFYASFGNVAASGARTLLALDVSGSMTMSNVAGVPDFSPRDASAAIALITAASEPNHEIVGFYAGDGGHELRTRPGRFRGRPDGLTPLAISPRQRLTDAVSAVSNLPFGGTDCALPMLYAEALDRDFDAFVIYTDSETWAGSIHPAQAITRYRQKVGHPVKLIVNGMVSNGFTIADPNDTDGLDVVGFDTATPQIISDFAGGRI